MATKRCPGCGIYIKSYLTYCHECAPKTGYNHCACPSCFEIQIGLPNEYCHECEEAGCGEPRTYGRSEEECLVERCECGGNIHRGECYCDEDEEHAA
jgi:hypothetical protein